MWLYRQAADLRKRIGVARDKLAAADASDAHRLRDLLKMLTERLQELQRTPAVGAPAPLLASPRFLPLAKHGGFQFRMFSMRVLIACLS